MKCFRKKLTSGELDDTEIELEVQDQSSPFSGMEIPGLPPGQGGLAIDLGSIFGKGFSDRKVKKSMTVAQSYDVLVSEEGDRLLDDEVIAKQALRAVEEDGIVFLDEIDKVTARSETRGADVSREGVQRDLLPLIEGTTVSTRHWSRQDRPHPVHSVRRVSRCEAVRPLAGVAGSSADPRQLARPH